MPNEGFKIGSAWLDVVPDTSQLSERLKEAVEREHPEINVGLKVDGRGLKTAVEKAAKEAHATADVGVNVDAKDVKSKVELAAKRADAHATVKVDVDKSNLGSLSKDMESLGRDASSDFGGGMESGMGAQGKLIAGIIPVALAALPAAAGAMGIAGGAALGAAFLLETNKNVQAAGTKLKSTFTSVMTQATAPMIKPLENAMSQLGSVFKSVEPQLKTVFASVSSSLKPMVSGIGNLLKGVLPGFTTMIKAASGPMAQFAESAGRIVGSGLGKFFSSLAPGMKASFSVLTSLMQIVGGLLPVIGKLSSDLATAFAPVLKALVPVITTLASQLGTVLGAAFKAVSPIVTQLLNVIGKLLPVLNPVIRAVSQVAQILGGILGNAIKTVMPLVSQIASVVGNVLGKAFTLIMPAIQTIAKLFSGVLSSALRVLMPVFSKLVSMLSGDFSRVLTSILPIILKLATSLGGLLAGAIKQILPIAAQLISSVFNVLGRVIPILLPVITKLASTIGGAVLNAMKILLPVAIKLISSVFQVLQRVLPMLLPVVSQLAALLGNLLAGAVKTILPIAVQLITMVFNVLAKILPVILPVLMKVATTLAGSLLKAISQLLPVFLKLVTAVLMPLLPIISQLLNLFAQLVISLLPLLPPLTKIITLVVELAAKLIILAVQALTPIFALMDKLIGWLVDFIGIVAKVIGWIAQIIAAFLNWVTNIKSMENTWNDFKNFFLKLWSDIWSWITNLLDKLVSFFKGIWTSVWNDAKNIWNSISSFFSTWWSNEVNGWRTILSGLRTMLSNAWNDVKSDASKAWGAIAKAIGTAFNAVKAGVAAPINWVVDNVAKGVDKITNALHAGKPMASFEKWQLAHGGILPGYSPGVDSIPAMLSPGEAVLTPGATRALGSSTINALNSAYRPSSGGTGISGGTVHAAWGLNPISDVEQGAKDVGGVIKSVGGGIEDVAKITAALATGNTTALTNALNGLTKNIPATGAALNIAEGAGKTIIGDAIQAIEGLVSGGGGNGASIVSYAESFNGHPYTWGGTPPEAFDCSSFVNMVLDHFGMPVPGGWHVGHGHGPATTQYYNGYGSNVAYGSMAPGDLYVSPTHMGIVTGPGKGFAARSTATGTGPQNVMAGVYKIIAPPGLNKGGGAPSGGATGTNMANGEELYSYLLTNLFGGNAIAAAGATASIWGESSWDPYSVGTGGRGLIGWTPPSKISDAVFKSGMSGQLPAIIEFVRSNGDMGVISQMDKATSVTQAANLWGHGVERFGISDIHPEGIQLATSFMSETAKKGIPQKSMPHFAGGGHFQSGTTALVGERGPELVRFNNGGHVSTARQTAAANTKPDVNITFTGTQYPRADQIQNLKLEMSSALQGMGV